jgi:pimeloyl-ACP methyl ester carboxylesterase
MKEFFMQVPEMQEVVIWGLCDAASAAAFYVATDDRVCGLVLLNPWVRTQQGAARAVLRNYYLARLGEVAFWKKVASGNLDVFACATALRQNMRLAASDGDALLPQRVVDSLAGFQGQVLVILSSDDLTAAEFARVMARHNVRAKRIDVDGANHTFASSKWRAQVAEASANWIMSW